MPTPSPVGGGTPPKRREMRHGLKPYRPTQRIEKYSSTKLREDPKTADDFLPNGPYDIALMSLRVMVYKVDCKSATPISSIIYAKFCGSSGGGSGSGLSKVTDLIKNSYSMSGPSQEWFFAQSEERKLEWPGYARLRFEVDEARKLHAARLRLADMEDVDVMYSGPEASIETYYTDVEKIMSTGGKPYHFWPLNRQARTMAISMLVKSKTLAKLCPPERLGSGYVRIIVNTPQASTEAPPNPKPAGEGTLFPYELPILGGRGVIDHANSNPEKRRAVLDAKIEEICTRKARSDSIQTIRDAKKGPWNLWANSFQPKGQTQPKWSSDNMPFTKRVPSDDEFYMDDLFTRAEQIKEWNDASKKAKQADGEHLTSETAPDESVAAVDFPRGLCNIYATDRNHQWHKENIEEPKKQANLLKCSHAEKRYHEYLVESKKHEYFVSNAVQNAAETDRLDDSAYQAMIKNMMHNRKFQDERLDKSKAQLIRLREVTGTFPTGISKGLEEEIETEQSTKHRGPPMKLSKTIVQPQKSEPVHVARPRGEYTETVDNPHAKKQAVPDDQTTKDSGIIPFPEYKDPMIENGTAEQVLGPTVTTSTVQALKDEAKARKFAKKSVGDILADTGVRAGSRHESVSQRSRAETAIRNPSSPATPIHLLGARRGMEDIEEQEERKSLRSNFEKFAVVDKTSDVKRVE